MNVCPETFNLCYSWKSTFIVSAQNVLHEIEFTPRHMSSWTVASVQRCLEHFSRFLWTGEEREKRDLDHADRDVGVSTRQVEEELNVAHMIIWRVLHEHLFSPFHLQRVQSDACWFSNARELMLLFCSAKCWAYLYFISAPYRWGTFR
jgi:hypothetical protein